MTEHLTIRQIAKYHKRALDPPELIQIDEHLVVCAECRQELDAAGKAKDRLSSFHDEVARDIDKKQISPSEMNKNPASQSLRPGLLNSPKSMLSLRSPGVAFGMGALAMLAVIVLVWLIVRPSRSDTTQPQVVQSTAPSPPPGIVPDNGILPNASPLPSPSPQVLMALTDGASQVGIDDKGNLVGFESLPPAYREMVKVALITQQSANLAALSGIGGDQGDLKTGQNQRTDLALLSPVGKVILTTRPTMRWSKLDGASEYRVEIYGSGLDLVASSPPLRSNSWELPNGLNRGEIYSWQVTATKDGASVKAPVPPAPEAKFKTLDAKQATDLTATQKKFAGSHLPLGVLYAQFGLLDDAEREFDALVRANPQSDIARKLLSNVRDARKASMK